MSRTQRIAMARELVADFETPLSVYQKLGAGHNSYLFESVEGGEKWGRYSLIGLPANTVYKVFGYRFETWIDGAKVGDEQVVDPLARIAELHEKYRTETIEALPGFTGGLVGFFGYDTVRYIEDRLVDSTPPDTLETPDIALMVSDEVAVYDNLSGTLTLVVHAADSSETAKQVAVRRLDELENRLAQPYAPLARISVNPPEVDEGDSAAFTSSFGRDAFCDAVRSIKQDIQAGEFMQVVPSQRLSAKFDAEPLNLYRALRRMNPSPYLYFLDMGNYQIVGSSPEVLSRFEDNKVTVRPIAGTRKRGRNEIEDQQLAAELLADPKEVAEHIMLIDLGRNDVGRLSKAGSVEVTENMVIERYSHVMHIVSNVVGEVTDGTTAIDVLKATLPTGTLSGAPKVAAMAKIDELEPVKRGIYGGAVGYLGWNGNMDTAIAIRTAVIKDGEVHVQAGAGIVADSDPESEWIETMDKAKAAMRAVDMASAPTTRTQKPATAASVASAGSVASTGSLSFQDPQDLSGSQEQGLQGHIDDGDSGLSRRKTQRRQNERRQNQRREVQRRSEERDTPDRRQQERRQGERRQRDRRQG